MKCPKCNEELSPRRERNGIDHIFIGVKCNYCHSQWRSEHFGWELETAREIAAKEAVSKMMEKSPFPADAVEEK